MKLYVVRNNKQPADQKFKPDGKLYLVDRIFLCQWRVSESEPHRCSILKPAGTFILAGRVAHKKSITSRVGKTRPERFSGQRTTKETLYRENSLYGVNLLALSETLDGTLCWRRKPGEFGRSGSVVLSSLKNGYSPGKGRLYPLKSITGVS